ncbi:MAG: hypothetical protein RLZ32_1508, partial [Gemmatimonadota bacterium]
MRVSLRSPRSALLLGALLLLPAARVHAQMGASSGLFGGIHYSGASLDLEGASKKVDFGGGYGLHAGLGLGNAL